MQRNNIFRRLFFSRTNRYNNEITYNDTKKIMREEANSYLIDVRSKQEYNEYHLPNSINLPVYNIEKDINTITNDVDSVIILYCQMGSRSRKALEKLERLGYKVSPKFDEPRADIVQTIELGSADKLIKFCQGIQMGSPIDSNVVPEPSAMAGYDDQVIMAAGTFTEGSTIELSCDGPIREPYIAYMQGGLTYEYGKLGILKALSVL